MKKPDEKISKNLAMSVLEMDRDRAVILVQRALESGANARLAVEKGLARGMEMVGEKYEKGEYYVPELLTAHEVMKAGLEVLQTQQQNREPTSVYANPQVVIGVMEGDFHEIGKDLVKIMLETGGFRVTDLGRDVPIKQFVEVAIKEDAGLICLSSLMSTSMLGMTEVIGLLKKKGVRNKFKVMVGGACVTEDYARQIGADGYAPNAAAALREARNLMQ